MKKELQYEILCVFCSCFLGLVIGTAVAREIYAPLWWVGMLAGFGTGYLLYRPGDVVWAIKKVWEQLPQGKDVANVITSAIHFLYDVRQRFQEVRSLVGSVILWMAAVIAYDVAVIGLLFLMTWTLPGLEGSAPWVLLLFICTLVTAVTFIFCFFGWLQLYFVLVLDIIPNTYNYRARENCKDCIDAYRKFLIDWNIFIWLAWCVLRIPHVVRNVVPFTTNYAVPFAVNFIGFIHSETRLLIGLDTALGVGILYWWGGNLILGALIGASLGVVHCCFVSSWVVERIPTKQ